MKSTDLIFLKVKLMWGIHCTQKSQLMIAIILIQITARVMAVCQLLLQLPWEYNGFYNIEVSRLNIIYVYFKHKHKT